MQVILIIVLIGADIMDYRLKALLAEWTLWLNLQEKCKKKKHQSVIVVGEWVCV
jgi:hypothetical protein